jgi:AMP nucleosidase
MKKQDAAGIVDRLEDEYRRSVDALRSALKGFLAGGEPPDPMHRRGGAYVYPELRLTWPPGLAYPRSSRAYARIPAPGR